MTWIAIIIGTLMVCDGLFSLLNRAFLEERVAMLPFKIDIRTVAIGELLAGLGVILSGTYAQIRF